MGKMMLILVVAFGVLFGLNALNIMQANTRMTVNAVDEYSHLQAKSLAESGIEYTVMKLALDTTWSSGVTLQASSGTIQVGIQNTTSRYPNGPDVGEWGRLVTSTGRSGAESVTIRAVIQIPVTDGVPPWMKYALISDEDLDLGGDIMVQDDGNSSWNSDVHTNKDLSSNGSVIVEGFGTYCDLLTLHPNIAARFFAPNYNPFSAPVTKKVPNIPIPIFDPSSYISIATQVFTGASTTITASSLQLGSYDNPQIIYVEGDLFLSGSFKGYGVFIVMGEVHVTGNVSTISVDPLGNNLGFYSAQSITFHGNSSATGQFYAVDDVVFSGNNVIHGLVVSKSQMGFQGDVQIYYRPASENLTNPFWPGEVQRPVIVSYYQ